MQVDNSLLRKRVVAMVAVVLAVGWLAHRVKAAPEIIGTIEIAGGQTLTITRLDPLSHLTSAITSCGQGVLYSTRTDGTLWVNLNGGVGAWNKVDAGTRGLKIACDRINLYSFTPNGVLWLAKTRGDGQLDPISSTQVWSFFSDGEQLTVPLGTVDIQGGRGNIYAMVFNSNTRVGTLYSSELRQPTSAGGYVQAGPGSWVQLATTGGHLLTGAGSKSMYTAFTSSLSYRKANRAFIANPDSTLYYNDNLLYGQNFWNQFPNPTGYLIESISADDSNTMYALALQNFGKRLLRFSFEESNCSDSLDNDANGLIDAEDPICRRKLATNWCQGRTGRYCMDRIEHSQGRADALVTCLANRPPTITAGRCTMGTLGNDSLTPDRANNEPVGSGHYCNIINPDGSWDFKYTGPQPCALLHDKHPNATVVRAGIYSTTGLNNVHVRCTNGGVTFDGIGTAPLESAFNGVGHTRNRCVFTVSPKAMRVFNAPFPTSVWGDPLVGGRGYSVGHVFDHVPNCRAFDPGCPCTHSLDCPVSLSQFGNGENGFTFLLDNHGHRISMGYNNQNSYDYGLNEGTPLRSLAYGRVISSRDRSLVSQKLRGTPYQGEIYIRYDIGSDPVYAESFIAYYAHVDRRVVVTGQTVAAGQLIGYVGTTGSSSGPHVHFGLVRLTNTNGRTRLGGEAFGWHVPFQAVTANDYGVNLEAMPGLIDPYGWRAPSGIDPMGYRWSNARGLGGVIGIGAWSPQMWTSPSETPPYPAPK